MKDIQKTKDIIKAVFAELRKEGYVCRMNFLCCQSCAGCEISSMLEDATEEKRKEFKGFVFYHNQDNEHFEKTGKLMLAYGNVSVNGVEFGIGDYLVGKYVATKLQNAGLIVNWNGDENKRLEVWFENE